MKIEKNEFWTDGVTRLNRSIKKLKEIRKRIKKEELLKKLGKIPTSFDLSCWINK